MLTVRFETDNAAFADDDAKRLRPQLASECARILRETAYEIEQELVTAIHCVTAEGWIRDANGNRVGTWKYENRD